MDDNLEEQYDTPSSLAESARRFAQMTTGSQHFVVFTGAGISTSSGISDTRTGVDTCLQTFGGTRDLHRRCRPRPSVARMVQPLHAKPSLTHMALLRLHVMGRLHHVISLNTDGLHRRSGFSRSALSELHGNTNLERCADCGMEVYRDYRVRNDDFVKANCPAGVPPRHFHATGRRCRCGGMMMDSIVNADEDLPPVELEKASQHATQADLFLVLGSSLQEPSSTAIVVAAKRNGRLPEHRLARALGNAPPVTERRLVLCNLQCTPLDSLCDLRVHACCDDFMRLVLQELAVVPAELKLKRRLSVRAEVAEQHGGPRRILVKGLDNGSNTAFGFIMAADFESLGVTPAKALQGAEDVAEWVGEQPPTTSVLRRVDLRAYGEGEVKWWAPGDGAAPGIRYQPLRIHLAFKGHHGETDLRFDLPECFGVYDTSEPRQQKMLNGIEVIYLLEFDASKRAWTMEQEKVL